MEDNKETVEDVKVEETGAVGTQANENKDEGKAEKTFTQSEVNAMEKKFKEKYEKKYAGIDIAKYNEWVESQKTAEQKQAEKETEYQRVVNELNTLKNTNSVLEAGVNKDFVKFISFEVSQMDGDFNENLAKFLEENPKYLGQELKNEPKATGAPVQSTGSTTDDGVLGILAQKHPNIKF